MQCESFESRLNEVLDARQPLSSAGDLQEHLRRCGQCRELARAYESVMLGLEQAELPPEPAGLSRRVVSELRQPLSSTQLSAVERSSNAPSRSRRSVIRRQRTILALAATVLLAIALPRMLDRGGEPAVPNVAAREDPAGEDQAHRVAETSHPRIVPTEDVPTEERVQVVAQAPSATAFLDPSQLGAGNLMGALPGTEWAHDVADGLEPVTKPTVGAINGFLQLWGVGAEGRRS